MIRACLLAAALAAVTAGTAQAQAHPDSIQAWTNALESGTLPEKVYAASKLANSGVTGLPQATLEAAAIALEELESLPDPIPGIEQLGDEDLAGYHVDLVVLASRANTQSADIALIPSVSVSVGVQRIVAQLGDLAVPGLMALIAGDRDPGSALETLGLAWFWADSADAPLSDASRAAIVGAFTAVADSGTFSARLGAAVAMGDAGDPAFLELARDFRDRMTLQEPWVVGFLEQDAIPQLEARFEQASLAFLTQRTARVGEALCYGATGDLATVCVAAASGFDSAAQALAAGDSAGAAQAFEGVRVVAEGAFAAGTLTASQRALLAGNAAVLIEEAGGLPGGPVTVAATADTDLRQGNPNQNQGSESILSLRASGRHRALVRAELPNVSSNQVGSARLEFDIVLNAENWGTSGRTIDAHRMLVAWTEGGATWNCPNDTEPGDPNADCAGAGWQMFTLNPSPYAQTASGSLLVTGALTGTVSIDVTADVQAMLAGQVSNHGWILRKTDEGAAGRIEIASRETDNGPRLVIELANE